MLWRMMKSMRWVWPVVAVAAVVVVVVPLAGASDPGPADSLKWGACPSGADPALRCSTLAVPLDYRHPEGRKIDLAVSRLASADQGKRRGVLLVDPGGPGLPGSLATPTMGLPQPVRDRYDVIGFDPRGIGRSAPLTCGLTPAQSAVAATPPYPRDAADVARTAETAAVIARQCTSSDTADVLPFVTTANTARDLDSIRAALGEEKMSYYGESYGTYLGAVYTTLFPEHSDRFVLDSSLPPEGYDLDALRSQALGFQTRFPDFALFAAGEATRYGLGSTPAAVTAKYYELAGRLDHAPAQGFDGTSFRNLTSGLLRRDDEFPQLASIWQALDSGQPLPAAAAPDGSDGSDGAGGAGFSDRGSFAVGYLSVVCNDSSWPTSVGTYQHDVEVDRLRYPMYGPITANIRPCAFWPAPAEPKVSLGGPGPADVLIVQNLRDPATPLPGALRTRSALGERARMVTIDQGGHVAYGAGNRCGNTTVTDYLVTGRLAPQDTFCPAETH
ncbi:alpha/beta hydrolase [Amycolatopsis sp. PS_44_ISF1]|uniref:alpha/beta hydrolase n=1 Tax=Amycolatopsis sp. PS_44_ISF1 TaxID=2974917 RepID=UPI0028DED6B8|nr:alpha/beta hydrolase [Amycolatopsis sp. PS_44_ISF1]MDT8912327.1 alpha/beta hydrolase [Amycolatopsis sp. PS_44_ISF1]